MIFGQIHGLSIETYTSKDKRNTLYTILYYLSKIVYDLKLLTFVITTTTTISSSTDDSLVVSLKKYYCFVVFTILF